MTQEENNSNNQINSDIQNISPEAFSLLKKKTALPKSEENLNIKKETENIIPTIKTTNKKTSTTEEEFSLVDHLSSINIAIIEDKKRLEEEKLKQEEEESEEYSKGRILIFISIILIILSLIITISFFIIKKTNIQKIPASEEISTLIPFENFNKVIITNINLDSFVEKIANQIQNSSSTEKTLDYYMITAGIETKSIKASDFIDLAKLRMPDILKRDLLEEFMLGSYTTDQKNPFLILKFSSFRNAYTGMLSWEENMKEDFHNLFGRDLNNTLEISTSTKINKFEDIVISNKYIRQLNDENGKTIILYGIIDSETIIITINDSTFKEILDRINKKALINI